MPELVTISENTFIDNDIMHTLTYVDENRNYRFRPGVATEDILDRLGAYEETGLSPKTIMDCGKLLFAIVQIAAEYCPEMFLGRLKELICEEAERMQTNHLSEQEV